MMIEYTKYFGMWDSMKSGANKFGNFMKTNKTAQVGAIGAGVGLLGGSLIARSKAKKEADNQGLTGSERSKYIRNQTLKGAAIGTVGGAALGAGGQLGTKALQDHGKWPFKKSDNATSVQS